MNEKTICESGVLLSQTNMSGWEGAWTSPGPAWGRAWVGTEGQRGPQRSPVESSGLAGSMMALNVWA